MLLSVRPPQPACACAPPDPAPRCASSRDAKPPFVTHPGHGILRHPTAAPHKAFTSPHAVDSPVTPLPTSTSMPLRRFTVPTVMPLRLIEVINPGGGTEEAEVVNPGGGTEEAEVVNPGGGTEDAETEAQRGRWKQVEREGYWKMMHMYIGSDVASLVTLPIIIFEPMSMLQRMTVLRISPSRRTLILASIKDLAKPENPYTRKHKNLIAFGATRDRARPHNGSQGTESGISKRVVNSSRSNLCRTASTSSSGSNDHSSKEEHEAQ